MGDHDKKGVMRWLVLLAPFLVAVVPVMNLWKKNVGQVTLEIAVAPIIASMLVAALVVILLMVLMRDRFKAVCMASIAMVLFSSFGYAFNVLWGYQWVDSYNTLYVLLSAALLVYLLLIGLVVWKKKNVEPLARFLFVVSLVLFVIPGFEIAKAYLTSSRDHSGNQGDGPNYRSAKLTVDSAETPDVYYIILDGYARQDSLLRHFDYDNSEFVQALRNRGFYVADQSTCNYAMTFLSLPSTLNMKYLDEEMERVGKFESNRTPFHRMIHDHEVGRFFQSKGYQYISVNTAWSGTEKSDIADIEMALDAYGLKGEFALAYLNSTAARVLLPSVADLHRFAFSSVERVPEIKGPTFTFAHMILPHQPFVFDANGNERKYVPLSFQITDAYKGGRIKKMYIEQLKYTNKRVLMLIDKLVDYSGVSPVIIIQSDHGSGMGEHRPLSNTDKKIKFEPYIKERHSILNAMLVPPQVKGKLYSQISSVNTFRVLFSELYEADFPLLKDVNYYSSYSRPCNVRCVTDVVADKEVNGNHGCNEVATP